MSITKKLRHLFSARRTATKRANRSTRLFAGLEGLEQRTLLSTMVWNGGPDGNGTNFLDPANWAGNVLPGNADTVLIGNTGNNPEITISGPAQVYEIDTTRSMTLEGGGNCQYSDQFKQ